ncbi:hypothetical protein ABIG06_001462 [Bradyrhizobium sp. USDA 326]|uniref:hypothetical protein n=1 Tax=Bradyrhizobium sp. USDA 326 TaxID=3377726 RepID=UPI003C71CC0E
MIAVIRFSYAAVVRFAALGIVLSAVAATSCLARAGNSWPVKHELIGKDGKKSKDVSGIACTEGHGSPRYCLVIDDNLQEAQFVTLKQGKLIAGEPAKLIDNTFKRKPVELDGEGVAFGSGRYYVKDGAGTYAVYSWDGRTENVKLLSEVPFRSSRKPEALLPLEKRGFELRVLILFDGDKEGSPTPVNVAAP